LRDKLLLKEISQVRLASHRHRQLSVSRCVLFCFSLSRCLRR